MQAQFVERTQNLQNTSFLRSLDDIFTREGNYTVLHTKLLSTLKSIKKDKRLDQSAKQQTLHSISLFLLNRGSYSLLTSTFSSVPPSLINMEIKLNLAKAYRFLAQDISTEEADACATALVNGQKHDLQRDIFEAFELFSDTSSSEISDYALLNIAEIYLFIAGKLSADKYKDGSYQILLQFALRSLNEIRNKCNPDYLLTAAVCHHGLGEYLQELDLYRQVLTTNYADKAGVIAHIFELRRLINTQAQLQPVSLSTYPNGSIFSRVEENISSVADAAQDYNHQQVANMLFHASVLEFYGQHDNALSIYRCVMSIKPSVETQQNMQRCDWFINARNDQQAQLPMQVLAEETVYGTNFKC